MQWAIFKLTLTFFGVLSARPLQRFGGQPGHPSPVVVADEMFIYDELSSNQDRAPSKLTGKSRVLKTLSDHINVADS